MKLMDPLAKPADQIACQRDGSTRSDDWEAFFCLLVTSENQNGREPNLNSKTGGGSSFDSTGVTPTKDAMPGHDEYRAEPKENPLPAVPLYTLGSATAYGGEEIKGGVVAGEDVVPSPGGSTHRDLAALYQADIADRAAVSFDEAALEHTPVGSPQPANALPAPPTKSGVPSNEPWIVALNARAGAREAPAEIHGIPIEIRRFAPIQAQAHSVVAVRSEGLRNIATDQPRPEAPEMADPKAEEIALRPQANVPSGVGPVVSDVGSRMGGTETNIQPERSRIDPSWVADATAKSDSQGFRHPASFKVVKFRITPERLGDVDVRVRLGKAQMSVRIKSDSEDTQSIIKSTKQELERLISKPEGISNVGLSQSVESNARSESTTQSENHENAASTAGGGSDPRRQLKGRQDDNGNTPEVAESGNIPVYRGVYV